MKLTVIIPCYNEENTIDELVNRVINNNYSNKEIIIIDDCSKDNSREIIAKSTILSACSDDLVLALAEAAQNIVKHAYDGQPTDDILKVKIISKPSKRIFFNAKSISKFSVNKTIFKLEYFGSPKKLYKEFEYYDYSLKENKGVWFLIKNE